MIYLIPRVILFPFTLPFTKIHETSESLMKQIVTKMYTHMEFVSLIYVWFLFSESTLNCYTPQHPVDGEEMDKVFWA